jgi:hypothetical protein
MYSHVPLLCDAGFPFYLRHPSASPGDFSTFASSSPVLRQNSKIGKINVCETKTSAERYQALAVKIFLTGGFVFLRTTTNEGAPSLRSLQGWESRTYEPGWAALPM